MHDPLVVAFEVRAPWLRRTSPVLKVVRWRWSRRHITIAGRWYYRPSFITVWHREPGGKDSGTVCNQHKHTPGKGWKFYRAWRFHVWHWRVQLHPWQQFRRWALTRCEWCGGRSRKGDQANVSYQWELSASPWWRGERGLRHMDCSSVERAHSLCLCDDPALEHDTYGRCARCDKVRSFGVQVDDADRALAALPKGSRITPEVRAFVEPLWEERHRIARSGSPR